MSDKTSAFLLRIRHLKYHIRVIQTVKVSIKKSDIFQDKDRNKSIDT